MTNQQILEQAIQKAIDGGWKPDRYLATKLNILRDALEFFQYDYAEQAQLLPALIFNHDFAKALWGEDLMQLARGNNIGQTITYHAPAWQVRLQDMVISEDPIKYLGENI